ncbi:uncharacterized protein A1O9_06349 [Exophiala aquamarina CBS 119918]|uniref:Homeobox domain-containing protein n=1 Tax=Exophiala aquamarina CBS 119918 TaxID=1182545 RepID=A0A072PGJ7_9EURO|nr:uncharacterized protein A1O9_06349 [Exophiala aquamarina CBS 119918]KEF58423.1 hypothetical protein A1O9_06349 [Exophiala aquamarina CBS 119918]
MAANSPDATEPDQFHGHLCTQYSFQLLPPATPASDSASLNKGRRRRTSPKDNAILAAAYQKNSKPDKAERALIVSQVDLGEKEVQIWFQNRRQNDRRKSKPLQPHELVAHLRTHSSSPNLHYLPSSSPRDALSSQQIGTVQSLAPVETPNRPASRASSIHGLLNPSSSAETVASTDSSQVAGAPLTPPSTFEGEVKVATSLGIKEGVVESDGNESTSEQSSARKRGHDEMSGMKDSAPATSVSELAREEPRAKEPLARTSSMVRLAMTVDGAVKIRTDNEPTPSPEKARVPPPPTSQAPMRANLSRSQSATTDAEAFRQSAQGQSKAVSAGFGRSRDSRTWEFYCDSTAKDALSIQAEAENAGSAVSAINLVRSNSFKSRTQALSPALSKSNVRTALASKNGKSKLSRTKSSMGRLQGFDSGLENQAGGSRSHHVRSPSGDSDKENWAPGTRASINPLRRTEPSINARSVLQANESVIFRDATPVNQLSHLRGKRAGSAQPSPSKEKAKGEEFDCVQGLLSLSQGAWR